MSQKNKQKEESEVIKLIQSSNEDILIQKQENDMKMIQRFFETIINFNYRALFGLLILFCFNLYPVYWYFLYVRYKKLQHLHKEGKLVFRSSLTTFIFLDFYFCICVNIVSLLCIIGFFTTIHDKIQKTFYDWAMNGFFLSLLYNGMRSFEQVYLSNDEDFQNFYATKDSFTQTIINAPSDKKFEFSRILSHKNFQAIGLGRWEDKYFHKQNPKTKSSSLKIWKLKCKNQVNQILQAENLDQTLFYLTLSNEDQSGLGKQFQIYSEGININDQQLFNKQIDDCALDNAINFKAKFSLNPLQSLESIGFRGKHNILSHFILPHYMYTRKYLHVNKKFEIGVTIVIVIIKVIGPCFYFFIKTYNLLIFFYMLIFIGFYLHIITMIIDSITNDDIKTKLYFIMALMKLLSIDEKNKVRIYISQIGKSEQKRLHLTISQIHKKKFKEGNYLKIEGNQLVIDMQNLTREDQNKLISIEDDRLIINLMLLRKENNNCHQIQVKGQQNELTIDISKVDKEKHNELINYGKVIDVSCKISLMGWNQARHVVLLMEQERQFQNNFTYLFLALYMKTCFLTFLICTAQGYTYIELGGLCQEEIIVYNQHVDFVLVGMICLVRIYYGSMFNEKFQEMKELIHRINSIYQDLDTLFDQYFTPGIPSKIDNNFYQELICQMIRHSIYKYNCLKSQKIIPHDDRLVGVLEQLQTLQKENLEKLQHTLKKITRQINQDSERFKEKFIFVYTSNFDRAWKMMSLLLTTFIPSLFNKIMNYLGNI